MRFIKQLMKPALLTFLAVAGITLTMMDSAEAQYRTSEERRAQRMSDWDTGYQDGTDCERLVDRAALAMVDACKASPSNRGTLAGYQCERYFNGGTLQQKRDNLAYAATIYPSSVIDSLVEEALTCREGRRGRFNSRVDSEDAEYERGIREERDRQQQADSENVDPVPAGASFNPGN